MALVKNAMESMMPIMMKGMSSEDKEEMMLKMMPMMLNDIDLAEMMPKMMVTMLPELLPELLEFLAKEGAHAKLLKLIATVMPNVCEVIDKPKLAEKKDMLLAELMSHDTFREKMPKCFAAGFPIMFKGFVEHFSPALTQEQKTEFIQEMITALSQGMETQEKEQLAQFLLGS